MTNHAPGRGRVIAAAEGACAQRRNDHPPRDSWPRVRGTRHPPDFMNSCFQETSAGRSGARFCEHWALQLTDWTDPRSGERSMELIPMWGFTGKLAEVARPSLSDYALYAKLETLDRRA